MKILQITSIIRNRGQLTIPEPIRRAVGWANSSSPVFISSFHPDEIVIRPKKELDWDKLWKQIKRVRAFKGKREGNLSAFIAKDRETRR